MADLFVDSAGSNTSPYDTWAKAATSLSTAVSACSAGDRIFVDDGFTQTVGGSSTLSFPQNPSLPVIVTSVDKATDAYSIGAEYTTGTTSGWDLIINGSVHFYGMTLACADDMALHNNIGGEVNWQRYEDCTFRQEVNRNDGFIAFGDDRNVLEIHNCTFDLSIVTSAYSSQGLINRSQSTGQLRVTGSNTVFNMGASGNLLLYFNSTTDRVWLVELEDLDLSSFTQILGQSGAGGEFRIIRLERCKLPTLSSITWMPASIGNFDSITASNCDAGTLLTPVRGLAYFENIYGTVEYDSSHYRTGGAYDGSANYCWSMVSTANAVATFQPLVSPAIRKWVSAGTQTLTLHLATASANTFYKGDFWCEISSPSEAGPTAQGLSHTSRANPFAANVELTQAGLNGWNGLNVDKAYVIEQQISPVTEGWVTIRCYLAKPSITHCYIDPKIEVL